MYTSILAFSVAASMPLINAYPITASGVNCRTGPGTSYDVVMSYDLGADISVTCQAPGTDIYGDDLWDLTSDGCYVADYYVQTGTSSYITSPCTDSGDGSSSSEGDLPGLDSTQSAHAREIIAEAQREGLGHQGCTAGITTALVESNIYIYANSDVPESFNYPYDDVSSDYDSVGIFQQRVTYYPDVAANMDPAQSAAQFFAQMQNISGWESMDIGTLCQAVQVSAYPDRYAEREAEASEICTAGGM